MKADVLDLVRVLSLEQADPILAERFYDETVADLALKPWLVNVSLVEAAAEATSLAFPPNAVKLLSVLYDDAELMPERLRGLEATDPLWRTRRGAPVAFVVEDEPTRTFRFYPRPEVGSKPFAFITGSPLGGDFPGYAAVAVHTETRQDVLPWMEMLVALLILVREYVRESDHRDANFAQLCQQVAKLLEALVG